jgi:predicted RNase H-related nuclease YkuK (DUF458 family)
MWTFISPSRGAMTLDDIVDDCVAQVQAHPRDRFKLIIGTDSQARPATRQVVFVSAIILHRVGKGARYYIHRRQHHHIDSLRQRMFTEASYSLQIGGMLVEKLHEKGIDWKLEVHVDVGEKGATRQLIREIVGWIEANGYEVRTKPDSCGASKVADRYTKL